MPRIYLFLLIIFGILVWVLWLWLGKGRVRTHRAAMLATAIPQALLAIAFVVLYLLTLGGVEMRALPDIWMIFFFISLGLATAAFLSSVVFAVRRKWEMAKGTGFGFAIGLIVFVPTFFLGFGLYS